jgi:hypothetical protein
LVVDALNLHADSWNVNHFACRAIAGLAQLPSNKLLLDRCAVCTAVTSALNKYVASSNMLSAVFMRDTSNAAVAQWGCTAIYYIARGTNHSILCCLGC